MGCNSSVNPLGDSDVDEACGIKVRVNPSTPESVNARKVQENNLRNANLTRAPPLAYDVPIHDEGEESLVKKHPPRRFKKLEDQQTEGPALTHQDLDERLKEADERRKRILTQRAASAKRQPRSFPNNQFMNGHNRTLEQDLITGADY